MGRGMGHVDGPGRCTNPGGSVGATCGRPGECGDHRRIPPHILFLFLTKRERAVDGPREKSASAGRSAQSASLRPPAGDGWPFRVAAFIKRASLGDDVCQGKSWIPCLFLSAGAALERPGSGSGTKRDSPFDNHPTNLIPDSTRGSWTTVREESDASRQKMPLL